MHIWYALNIDWWCVDICVFFILKYAFGFTSTGNYFLSLSSTQSSVSPACLGGPMFLIRLTRGFYCLLSFHTVLLFSLILSLPDFAHFPPFPNSSISSHRLFNLLTLTQLFPCCWNTSEIDLLNQKQVTTTTTFSCFLCFCVSWFCRRLLYWRLNLFFWIIFLEYWKSLHQMGNAVTCWLVSIFSLVQCVWNSPEWSGFHSPAFHRILPKSPALCGHCSAFCFSVFNLWKRNFQLYGLSIMTPTN